MKVKHFEIQPYSCRLTLIHSNDIEEVRRYFRRIDFDFEAETMYAHAINHKYVKQGLEFGAVYIVLNDKNEYRALTLGTIAHEAFHASNMIFDQVGALPDIDNDEPQAYLIGYITDLIIQFLTKAQSEQN